MQPVIEIKNLTKMYGNAVGVKNITLDVMPGSIFGFLGSNGAGKTTTISTMVDLLRPTHGGISIFGQDSVRDSLEIRKRIGYLAGDFALDKGLTGWQQLEYFGNLRGNYNKKYVRELAERLNCKLSKKFKTLSRGNKQKVGLISALMHDPELLILDEPTSGLDPLIQAEFNKILLERKKRGRTAFVSSHVLSEVQEVCDQVAFIRDGSLVAVKAMDEIASGLPKQLLISSHDKELPAKLRKLTGIHDLKQLDGTISCTFEGDINKLMALLAKCQLTSATIQDADLETVFMKYYERKKR
jgi:ABC-2 type transport system ATP-binding protein